MKKNNIYVIIAALVGLGLGYLFFGSSTTSTSEDGNKHTHATADELWTCSMHPQILKNEPGDCPICGMELIPASGENDSTDTNQFKMTENAMALANIQTSIVGNSTVGNSVVKLSGKIKPNEDKTYTQSAHFNGRIEKLYIKSLGETVQKGQPIAVVYSPELVSAQQELITASKMQNSQPKLYEAVKNKFMNWMIPEKEINDIINSGKAKSRFTIYAHISGVVTSLDVSEGGHMMDGKPIFQTADLQTVWAVFDAYEKQIPILKVGQEINITSNSYPNKILTENITYIDPILNTETRTVEIRTVLNNKDNLLKPGMFVEGEIANTDKTISSQLNIPTTSVMWTGKRSVVYVKQAGETPVFEMREIEIGANNGTSYTVISGLKNGEEIVTNGTFTVDAAAQLQGKPSMMKP